MTNKSVSFHMHFFARMTHYHVNLFSSTLAAVQSQLLRSRGPRPVTQRFYPPGVLPYKSDGDARRLV